MKLTSRLLLGMIVAGGVTGLWLGTRTALAQQSFDKLSAEDRKIFQERFEKELWPLMMRNEKDGCIGCHTGKKTVTDLRLTGAIEKDFPKMLKMGFFIPDDAGSLLGRVTDKDKKRHMPPPPRKSWTPEEIQLLRTFVMDMDKKQKK